jgi:hypothetical protein
MLCRIARRAGPDVHRQARLTHEGRLDVAPLVVML